MRPQARPTVDTLIRRQLIMALVAAGVVLVSVVLVAWAVPDGETGHAVLRVTPDGSHVVAASPVAQSSRWAVWIAFAALAAVGGVLVALVHHTLRVARSTLAGSASSRETP